MEKLFRFCCPNCGSDGFIKKELVELSTHYYNPPFNYHIQTTIKDEWAWSSETETEEFAVKVPSFFCEQCDLHLGNFEHTEAFIENGFKKKYIVEDNRRAR